MKKIIFILTIIFSSHTDAQIQQIVNKLPQGNKQISQLDIASGLKEALQNGIEKEVSKLTAVDGFLGNELVKIMLPDELKVVDSRLRSMGLSNLADEGIKMLNRAAEDAVKEATPIFIDAVKTINFNDAKNILMGENNAATVYLQQTTTKELYFKFTPVIKNSFQKVGADQVWENIIARYNRIPLVKKVNPDLIDYTANKAIKGVFKMIAIEEINIRKNSNARTTELLNQVFALQDKQ